MDLHNQTDLEQFVGKYLTPERLTKIYDCVMSAHKRYRKNQTNDASLFMTRTKANIINDYIVNNVKNEFDNDKVRFKCYYIKKQTFRLSINDNEGAVILRFKKMDKKLMVHNIPTQQALSFNEQQTLFGPTVNINAGYVTDGLENRVYVTCPESNSTNRLVWEIEPQRKAAAPILPIMQPSTPPTSPLKRNVAPRKEITKEHGDVK